MYKIKDISGNHLENEKIIADRLSYDRAVEKIVQLFNEDFKNKREYNLDEQELLNEFPNEFHLDSNGIYSYEYDGHYIEMDPVKEEFDLFFDDDTNTESAGFTQSLYETLCYIENNNGGCYGYFKDYRKGSVSIIKSDGKTVYREEIGFKKNPETMVTIDRNYTFGSVRLENEFEYVSNAVKFLENMNEDGDYTISHDNGEIQMSCDGHSSFEYYGKPNRGEF